MIKARVLAGNEFQYTSKKTGEILSGYTIWISFEGCPYSFKVGFFRQDDIAKAKAAVAAGSAVFDLVPDRNAAPSFVLR